MMPACLQHELNADQSEERLAALFVKSGILAEVLPHQHWKPHDTGVDLGTAACMLKALIAAYVHEPGGDFYSAVRLWHWLVGADELRAAIQVLSCATEKY